ncbi:hypothetical protein EBZ02_06845, partial [bacterium]|nr:hypothetical protein [bacterium]
IAPAGRFAWSHGRSSPARLIQKDNARLDFKTPTQAWVGVFFIMAFQKGPTTCTRMHKIHLMKEYAKH